MKHTPRALAEPGRGNHPSPGAARVQAAASKPRKHPLFAARAPREVHARLKAAAVADGLTIADELTRLLDLRARVEAVSRPAHPLSRPLPVDAVPPDLRVVQQDSAAKPVSPKSRPRQRVSANQTKSPKSSRRQPLSGTVRLDPVTWLPLVHRPEETPS